MICKRLHSWPSVWADAGGSCPVGTAGTPVLSKAAYLVWVCIFVRATSGGSCPGRTADAIHGMKVCHWWCKQPLWKEVSLLDKHLVCSCAGFPFIKVIVLISRYAGDCVAKQVSMSGIMQICDACNGSTFPVVGLAAAAPRCCCRRLFLVLPPLSEGSTRYSSNRVKGSAHWGWYRGLLGVWMYLGYVNSGESVLQTDQATQAAQILLAVAKARRRPGRVAFCEFTHYVPMWGKDVHGSLVITVTLQHRRSMTSTPHR